MPVAPFDGTCVDIVASLHLAVGTVVSCFVLVVSLGCALKISVSFTSRIIYSFSSLFPLSIILVSCLNWLSLICGRVLS